MRTTDVQKGWNGPLNGGIGDYEKEETRELGTMKGWNEGIGEH
jgi:hypothetical protein